MAARSSVDMADFVSAILALQDNIRDVYILCCDSHLYRRWMSFCMVLFYCLFMLDGAGMCLERINISYFLRICSTTAVNFTAGR